MISLNTVIVLRETTDFEIITLHKVDCRSHVWIVELVHYENGTEHVFISPSGKDIREWQLNAIFVGAQLAPVEVLSRFGQYVRDIDKG